MRTRRTFSRATVVVLAGALLVPAAALARGGFAHGGHGPVFGFPHARMAPHHQPSHFAHGFRLHRFARHRDGNGNGTADAGYAGGSSYPNSAYDSGDSTGTLAPDGGWRLPAAPAPEHAGCVAHGYDVPSESGGVAHVTVTRC